jgi:hypothetical protein
MPRVPPVTSAVLPCSDHLPALSPWAPGAAISPGLLARKHDRVAGWHFAPHILMWLRLRHVTRSHSHGVAPWEYRPRRDTDGTTGLGHSGQRWMLFSRMMSRFYHRRHLCRGLRKVQKHTHRSPLQTHGRISYPSTSTFQRLNRWVRS